MKAIAFTEVLNAAAYALLSERCRPTSVHDLRGSLQALQGAVELLGKSVLLARGDAALTDHAMQRALRSLATHEVIMMRELARMSPIANETSTPIELQSLLDDILKIVRNDAYANSISLKLDVPLGLRVTAQAHHCRLLLTGLCVIAVDNLTSGGTFTISAAMSGPYAEISIGSFTPSAVIRDVQQTFLDAHSPVYVEDLWLTLTSQWAEASGGRLDWGGLPHHPLRLYMPLG